MKPVKKLSLFSYVFDKGGGPLNLTQLQKKIKNGNCRLAVQDYYYIVHNLYLKPEQILLPQAFKKIGKFIRLPTKSLEQSIKSLQLGDIIYAERLRNKKGKIIYKPKTAYQNKDQWILHFHSAIYLGKLNSRILSFIPFKTEYPKGTPVIWHSSFISDGTALWSLEKFLYYYQFVAVKRILPS